MYYEILNTTFDISFNLHNNLHNLSCEDRKFCEVIQCPQDDSVRKRQKQVVSLGRLSSCITLYCLS